MSFRSSRNAQLGRHFSPISLAPTGERGRGRPGPGPRARGGLPRLFPFPPGSPLPALRFGRQFYPPGPSGESRVAPVRKKQKQSWHNFQEASLGPWVLSLPSLRPRGPKFPGSELRSKPHSQSLHRAWRAERSRARSRTLGPEWQGARRKAGGRPGLR